MDIPENLGDLKRPALQKLCKRLGLKANGKNVDMISAIRDFKSQASLSSDDDTHTEAPPTAIDNVEEPMLSPSDNKHAVKKGRKRKRRSRRNTSLQSQKCSEETSATRLSAVDADNLQETVASTSESQEMGRVSMGRPNNIAAPTCSSPPTSQKPQKRKRRGTHSISPPPKQLRASIPVVEPSPLPEPPSLPVSKVALETDTHEPSIADKEVHPPISPPESTGRLSNRKRRATFSISPPPSSRGPTTPNVDINVASSPLQPPAPKRSRQSATEVSPQGDEEPSGLVGECVDLDSSVKNEILTLLHQRVDDRKADPSYKPVFGTTEPKTSRIPVKSATARKFERAHQRQFTNMTSIVDHQIQKQKRAAERKSSVVSAKKPRVGEAPVPSRILNATKSSQRNASGPFKPSVLSTKNVSLNFRQSLAKTGTAEVRKVSKTPNKPFVFSGKDTPKSNQGRTAVYKPHTGALPQFNFSLY